MHFNKILSIFEEQERSETKYISKIRKKSVFYSALPLFDKSYSSTPACSDLTNRLEIAKEHLSVNELPVQEGRLIN
ncbi:MAG: hypothetical protein AAFN81_06145 [Bacteroidota bacterium]